MPLLEARRILPLFTLPNDAGTYPVPLPRTGQILDLDLYLSWTNGATSNQTESIYDAIDRIEVVAEGSNARYSLTGQQARLWTHTIMKMRPHHIRDETPSVAQTAHLIIPFSLPGLYDRFWLECSDYRSLELRITYSPTIAATQFATGTGTLVVYANMWNGGVPGARQGCLRLTEQEYWASLASGDHNYDLPIGNPYFALGLYAFETTVTPQSNIDSVEVDIDNGSWSPVEGLWEHLSDHYCSQLGIDNREHGIAYKSNTDTIETWTGEVYVPTIEKVQSLTIGTTDEHVDIVSDINGGVLTIASLERDAAATASDAANTTDHPIKWTANGKHGLGNFLPIPFGYPNHPEQSLPSGQYGRVTFRATQGNAGAECRLSLLEIASK